MADSGGRQIARAAGVVMAGFVLSNLVGLARQVLVSHAFGTGADLDAFNTAARLPELLFSLIAGGALASAFVPTFTGLLARDDRAGSWRLASAIVNLVLLALTGLALLCALLAPALARLLAPDYPAWQLALTASLLRIMLLSSVIFGASGLLMGVLNAHQHFWLPALAPSLYWSGVIFGVLALAPRMDIFGLAWGVVIGAALHLLVQLPGLRGRGARYLPTLGLRAAAVREVARLMGPRLIGVAVVQINFLVNTVLASGMPEGSLSAIALAWAVMTMPQVVIAQAIAIAALPTFSAQVARGQLAEMRAALVQTLRAILFLALPASVGLVLLRRPLVILLFERGAFDERSVMLVSWALLWYAVGLVGHSLVEILSRAFYALHDTRTPVAVGAVAMSLNVALSLLFARLFERAGWLPHGGLALANSLATALETAALLWL
ncbi:MAG: murein biosynthesis integral membrane protein MurJ, partial [Chloroflexi bacterium]|nr:murein biosynthesis integral membrane protein MurJ [Chloroflexota bacterium]